MKNYLVLLLFLLLKAKPATSQIPTPDFRFYTSCPTSYGQVTKCDGWVQPTFGSSDYFNSCTSGLMGVPQNFAGYQPAATNAYMGILTYYPPAGADYKEYISTDFPPLTIGQTYTMSITVSLADSSTHATDGLGVYFTTYPFSAPTHYTTLLVNPQVDYSSFGTITDKDNWVKLSKSFVADSAYTHLILGCFKPTDSLQIDSLSNGSTLSGKFCYYYLGQIGEPDSNRHLLTDSVKLPPVDSSKVTPRDSVKYTFPSAFTPNGDALNDVFRIISSPGAVFNDFGLHIFNRWGQRIFSSNDHTQGWDGTFNGTPQDIDVYFYFAEFTVNGKHDRSKGNITLIR